jgi:hypothetical protein
MRYAGDVEPLPSPPAGVLDERGAPPSGLGYRDAASQPALRVSFHHAALTRRARAVHAAIVFAFALSFLGMAAVFGSAAAWSGLPITFALGGIALVLGYLGVVSLFARVVIECDATRLRAGIHPGLFYRRVELPVVDVESVAAETSRLDGVEYRVVVRAAGAAHVLPGRLEDRDGAVSKYTAAVLAQHLRESRPGKGAELEPAAVGGGR